VAAEPKPKTDRQKMLTILIPAGGLAVIIILVGIVIGTAGNSPSGKDKNSPAAKLAAAGGSAPSKLSDGTDPGADDPGLKDIGDGLKIRDLKVGEGQEVKPGATVTAHYTGWLMNGKSFDSSIPRGEPTSFSLLKVVPGWQKGLPGMKVGGIRKLVIPAEMGYGTRGNPPDIPPNSTLVFEVEMMGVK
jgi:peptidylprolyl isomerase